MDTRLVSTEEVPIAVLSSILRDHLKDPEAQLTGVSVTPISSSGVSGNNSFYRAEISWAVSNPMVQGGASTWLIKRWTPGGLSLAELGWNQPIEALAWQQGILRPEALPGGIKTPIIGSVIDPGGEVAWLAMADVARDLREYDRSAPLPSEQLVERIKTILASIARFHVYWEVADRQEFLDHKVWLVPFENYLWRKSAFYAAILGKDAYGGFSQVAQVDKEDVSNLYTFLEWLNPSVRPILEGLLVDRRRLVDGFAEIPCTLLHGDLDDRNIGLTQSSAGESELVLIDWERMSRGPAAMDVAKLLILVFMLCEPGAPIPDSFWSDELPDFYYENYRRAGGNKLDHDTWRKSYDLALIAEAVWPFPWALGNLMRTFRGEIPLSEIPGLPNAGERVHPQSNLENLSRMAEVIMGSMQRSLH
jgi:hypothetical protein